MVPSALAATIVTIGCHPSLFHNPKIISVSLDTKEIRVIINTNEHL